MNHTKWFGIAVNRQKVLPVAKQIDKMNARNEQTIHLPQPEISEQGLLKMEIRQIELSDAKNFITFYNTLVKQTDFLLSTIEEATKTVQQQESSIKKCDDYKQIFIAIEDNEIVGFMGISRSPMSKVKHIANFAIGVLDAYKRQSVATNLLSFAENWLKDKGVSRLEMTVISENKPAIKFYEKNGFSYEGTRHNSIKMNNKFYDELFMAKNINKENNKNIIIIHGTEGSPNGNWFPWLKSELEKLGYKVYVPEFPTPENQSVTNWNKVLKERVPIIDESTVLIGHSCGATYILHILEQLNLSVFQSVFISGFIDNLDNNHFDTLNKTFINHNFDWEKIIKNAGKITIFHGNNDPYVPMNIAKNLSEKLKTKINIIPNGGHLNDEFGYTQFPALLKLFK